MKSFLEKLSLPFNPSQPFNPPKPSSITLQPQSGSSQVSIQGNPDSDDEGSGSDWTDMASNDDEHIYESVLAYTDPGTGRNMLLGSEIFQQTNPDESVQHQYAGNIVRLRNTISSSTEPLAKAVTNYSTALLVGKGIVLANSHSICIPKKLEVEYDLQSICISHDEDDIKGQGGTDVDIVDSITPRQSSGLIWEVDITASNDLAILKFRHVEDI